MKMYHYFQKSLNLLYCQCNNILIHTTPILYLFKPIKHFHIFEMGKHHWIINQHNYLI